MDLQVTMLIHPNGMTFDDVIERLWIFEFECHRDVSFNILGVEEQVVHAF